jgi:hypothetical protein
MVAACAKMMKSTWITSLRAEGGAIQLNNKYTFPLNLASQKYYVTESRRRFFFPSS